MPHGQGALARALSVKGPVLLDIARPGTENVYPMVPPGKSNVDAIVAHRRRTHERPSEYDREAHGQKPPGAMSHITGFFSRRGFNLEGILCAPVDGGEDSAMYLLVRNDERLEQIVKQLGKLYDVKSVIVQDDLDHTVFNRIEGTSWGRPGDLTRLSKAARRLQIPTHRLVRRTDWLTRARKSATPIPEIDISGRLEVLRDEGEGRHMQASATAPPRLKNGIGFVSRAYYVLRRGWKWFAIFLTVTGPGVIVMIADNDAGGITTYAATGASYGYGLLWFLIILGPVAYVIQEMTVRLGAVTKRGHAEAIFDAFGPFWGWFSLTDLILTDWLTLITEFIGMTAALSIFHVPPILTVIVVSIIMLLMVLQGRYWTWEKIAFLFCLLNLVYIPGAILVHPSVSDIIHSGSFRTSPGASTTRCSFSSWRTSGRRSRRG